jgi:hypothetical protein
MKLSDSLLDLAGRVKRVEDSAVAVQARNRAALEARRTELEAAIDKEVSKVEQAGAEAAEEARGWWSDIKGSVDKQIAEMRADFEKWQAAAKERNAERAAEAAEEDAVAAVALAAYCLDAAEWAVVRAELARGEAEQLAGKASA